MSDSIEETKVDLQSNFSQGFFASDEPSLDVEIAAVTHPGNVRTRNEDHYAVFQRTRRSELLLSNLPSKDVGIVDDKAYGLLIADGIGGAQFGDFASQLALETTLEAAGLATSWVMKFKDLDVQEVRQRVAAYVDRIQDTLTNHGIADPEKRDMGTTFTGAYLIPPHAIIAHIGDSRAYLFRGGELTQITHDQTLAQAYIDAGAEKEDVKKFGHLLMNSLGSARDQVDVDVMHVVLQAGDRMLLCTDGLSDMVDEESIEEILATCELQTACDTLLEAALEQGGKDNITIVVCDFSFQPEE